MQYFLRVFRLTGCENMSRLFKNKKAVSPVIATVLMILVTMAGMAILFGFVISYSDSYKAGIGSSVMESLTIEDIWFSPGNSFYNSQVQISVYNAGKVDSTITSIYVNGEKLTDSDRSDGNFNLKISVSAVYWDGSKWLGGRPSEPITLYWPGHIWQAGITYTFTVATQKGSTFDVTYTAPQN
jgi:flagellin-like protein